MTQRLSNNRLARSGPSCPRASHAPFPDLRGERSCWTQHTSIRILLSISLALLASCARGGAVGVDSGTVRFDSGPRADAGPAGDGGPDVDGGPLPDLDAGPAVDGGTIPDIDSGTIPEVDSGGIDRCAGIDCSAMTTMCAIGACNPATGTCAAMPRADGFGCDDGNLCTTGDSCSAGACSAGAAVDCSAMASACATAACSASTGACVVTPAAEGMSCGAATGCTSSACRSGACVSSPTADCGSCGAGMYCAAGTCGPSPTSLSYGFESGTIPAAWTNGLGGTAPWTIDASGAHGGTYRARSGVIGDSLQSRMSMTITLASAAEMSFWLMTSTESCCDHLELYVDGTRVGQWQGTTAWTQGTAAIATGTHTLEWRYAKDGSLTAGSDAVWIDDITFGPGGNPSTGFESATLPAGYTTSGSASWLTDTVSPHGGSRAAASGDISDSQTSSMFRTVALPSASTLTFWYRVSSESGYDYLDIYIDGTVRNSYAGEVAWTLASYPLTAGSHTVEWRYRKDGSLSNGSDRVWIDDVDFGFTPTTGGLCGP